MRISSKQFCELAPDPIRVVGNLREASTGFWNSFVLDLGYHSLSSAAIGCSYMRTDWGSALVGALPLNKPYPVLVFAEMIKVDEAVDFERWPGACFCFKGPLSSWVLHQT